MKRIAAFGLALSLLGSASAFAGTIVLSGDSNIFNGGGIGDLGNQQFFQNVLAGGTTVVVQQTTIGFGAAQAADVDAFYDGLSGVSASVLAAPVTDGALAGADLFVSILPAVAYTGAELAALSNFLAGGGTVFFLGENSASVFSGGIANINAALGALGSGMSIVPDNFDAGYNFATILVDPLTAGVSTFQYAAPSQVSGGTPLFAGTQDRVFLAYEGVAAVPEPTTLLLLGTGLGAVAARRRLKKRA